MRPIVYFLSLTLSLSAYGFKNKAYESIHSQTHTNNCNQLAKKNAVVSETLIIDTCLQVLLEQKDFFRLRRDFNTIKNKLNRISQQYFIAFIENAFLNPEKSNDAIQTLLSEKNVALSDSIKVKLLMVQEDNFNKMYQYAKACETAGSIVKLYSHSLDSSKIEDEENNIGLWCSLKSVSPQKSKILGTSVIPFTRNNVNLLNIPISIGGYTCDFLFDTGGDISVICKSYAEKLKLRRLDATIDVKGTSGKSNSSEVAVADSIQLGDIIVYNVVFLVLPDEKLTFPQANLVIHGIIGFPVMFQLKELRFSKDGFLTIPVKTSYSNLNNLAMNGSKSIVQFISDRDTLALLFDTGANASELYKSYYEKHKSDIEKNAIPDSLTYGSLGETTLKQIYKIRDFPFDFEKKRVVIPYVSVYTNDSRKDHQNFDGCVGQDLISLFNEMIIDYEYMYVDFK
jgi:predicted aspartyl protease